MTAYLYTKFGLIWIKETKVTERDGIRSPHGWERIKSPRWDRVELGIKSEIWQKKKELEIL